MSKPLTRRAAAATVMVVALVVSAAGCSSEGDDADATTTSTWAGTVRTTVRPTTTITNPPYAPQGTETEDDYAEAFIAAHQARTDPLFSGVDIACVAPKWVAAITVESFFATGITPANIAGNEAALSDLVGDDETAAKIVDAVPECGLPLVDLYVQDLGPAVSGDPAKVACIRSEVTDDEVRDALVSAIVSGEVAAPTDLAGTCLA